jgi:uncharacterized membrane protein
MASTDYHFIDRWRVRGTVNEVADILGDGPEMARWWPSTYLSITPTSSGDERGIGATGAVHAKGWLPYTIRFNYRVTDVNYPYGYAIDAEGDLTGRGVWTFAQDGDWVDITYEWTIRADKPILRVLSPLIKPILRSNHNWTMRNGEKSLVLELQRRRAKSELERRNVPPPPGPASNAPWVAAAALLVGGIVWLARGKTTLRVSHSIVIQRPISEVFAYVTDVTHDLEWQPDIQEVTVTSPGPITVGSTFREVRRTLGRTYVWNMRITAFERNRRICIESIDGTVPYRGCRVFTGQGGGTRITETSEVQLPRLYAPFKGMLARLFTKPVAEAYERLKEVLEYR